MTKRTRQNTSKVEPRTNLHAPATAARSLPSEPPTARDQRVDSRPLSPEVADRVRATALAETSATAGVSVAAAGIARRAPRHEYALDDELLLTVALSDQPARHYLVRPRNISTCGLGFLHSAPLPLGTVCCITLRTSSGGAVTVDAEVTRSCALSGASHVVGIRFRQPIDIHAVLGTGEARPRA